MKLKPYLKNDKFEGIVGKEEFLILMNNQAVDTIGTVLISIHDPAVPNRYNPNPNFHSKEIIKKFDDALQISFWDIEEDFGKYKVISQAKADIIRNFILKNIDKKFFIHCHAGISRSAAVGAAVECFTKFNGNLDKYLKNISSSDIFNHKRYMPNRTVLTKICKN